ncbi:hypothetical protein CMI41_03250 [Candidatus Pacearchaeota archaeon]|nr:hypothetical protein [Candidatus Pacearchaeota archaeon]|tara:strand:+ start:1430 stop:2533 length:1104 start_codon:yes stop_codon:yes gene_type:complete
MVKKILFLGTFPPPHYGASILNGKILEILKVSKNIVVKSIKLNYSKDMADVGKINLHKIGGIFKVRAEILRSIKSFKPDLIYFAPATAGRGLKRDNFFVQIIKQAKIPILFHVHSRVKPRKLGERRLLKKMFKDEKAIVLGTELIKDLSWILPQRNIFIIPNAIQNIVSENNLKKELLARKKEINTKILFLSNMDETKGWLKLLQSCDILNRRGINFECRFVGAWPSRDEEERFSRYVLKNRLSSKIKYLGKQVGVSKEAIFASSDIFVFPTEYPLETFGLVILEAMMHGLPVIANGIATIPSTIIHEKTGFVLKKNSPTELADYLEELIHNPPKGLKMGAEGRKRFLREFEIERYGGKLLNLISNI